MNNYEYEEEREISLRDLIMYVLLRWRSILIVALLGAFLGGAASYVRSDRAAKAVQNNADLAAEEELSSENYSGTIAAIAGMEKLIDGTSKYIHTSPYMQMDPYHAWVSNGTIRIELPSSSDGKILPDTAERYAYDMTREMWDSEALAKLAEELQTDLSYLGEMICVNVREISSDEKSVSLIETLLEELSGTAYIDISAFGVDAAMAEKIYQGTVDALMSYRSPDSGLKADLEISRPTTSPGVQSEVLLKQNNTYYSLRDYNDRLTNLNATLTKLQDGSTSGFVQHKGGHVSKKFVLLGFVGSGFLICLFYLMRYVLQDLLRTESDLTGILNIRMLGRFTEKHAKKPLEGIDQLIRKFGGVPKHVSEEETLRMVETNIRNYTGAGRKLLITSSGTAKNFDRIASKIRDCLGEEYSCSLSPDILNSVETRQKLASCEGVILVETLNKSKYAEVAEEARLIRDMNKEIVGSVLA